MPKQKRVSTLSGIIIIVVAAVILFGGVFAYQYFFTNPQPIVQTQTTQTANWKTYTSEKDGYSVKYPDNWKITLLAGGVADQVIWNSPVVRPENIDIDIYSSPKETGDTLVNGCPDFIGGTGIKSKIIGNMKFNGLSFCKYTEEYMDGIPPFPQQRIFYVIANGDYEYLINLNVFSGRQTANYYLPESEFKYESGVVEQMLSTLKFTK